MQALMLGVLLLFTGQVVSGDDASSLDGVYHYIDSVGKKYFYQAEAHCESLKMHLASIHTQEQFDLVDKLRGGEKSASVGENVWIGLVATARRSASYMSGSKGSSCVTTTCWAWTDGSPTYFSYFGNSAKWGSSMSTNYPAVYLNKDDKFTQHYGDGNGPTLYFVCSTISATSYANAAVISEAIQGINKVDVCQAFGTRVDGCEMYCESVPMDDPELKCGCAGYTDDPALSMWCPLWVDLCYVHMDQFDVEEHCGKTCCFNEMFQLIDVEGRRLQLK